MTAMERIKILQLQIGEIEEINKKEPQPIRAFTDESGSFLLKSFRVMREIAIEYSKAIAPDELKAVEPLLDYEFEARMKE